MPFDEAFWQEEFQRTYEMIISVWAESAWWGAQSVMTVMNEQLPAVDEAEVWAAVLGWVHANAVDRALDIAETTRRAVEEALAVWSGDPAELDQLLEPIFGSERAATIGITEAITGITIGNLFAWAAYAIIVDVVWVTAEDEKVCPICRPLHDTVIPLTQAIAGTRPPAHPRCRCKLEARFTVGQSVFIVRLPYVFRNNGKRSEASDSQVEQLVEALAGGDGGSR